MMSTTKEEIKGLLDKLLDDCSVEDVQYHLYVVRWENDLAPFHEALAERGYGLDNIGRRLAVFANFGRTERRSPERFGFIIQTGIAEER